MILSARVQVKVQQASFAPGKGWLSRHKHHSGPVQFLQQVPLIILRSHLQQFSGLDSKGLSDNEVNNLFWMSSVHTRHMGGSILPSAPSTTVSGIPTKGLQVPPKAWEGEQSTFLHLRCPGTNTSNTNTNTIYSVHLKSSQQ